MQTDEHSLLARRAAMARPFAVALSDYNRATETGLTIDGLAVPKAEEARRRALAERLARPNGCRGRGLSVRLED